MIRNRIPNFLPITINLDYNKDLINLKGGFKGGLLVKEEFYDKKI